ncbi:hypothetical protein QBC38DRAFT_449982 [Podospora fimiseda]|uniref:Uncharacterized protein n=1 Tax=Podospora fimiseda TaxID=252190 RepID=A0AAN7BE58_9PEZI|nr:hypothetical protein QBC38DRAFT_449982 [Podospora fimiseda]
MRKLIKSGGIIFRPRKCTICDYDNNRNPDLRPKAAAFHRSSKHEWLIFNEIPEEAIVGVIMLNFNVLKSTGATVYEQRKRVLQDLGKKDGFVLFPGRPEFDPAKTAKYLKRIEETHRSNEGEPTKSRGLTDIELYSIVVWRQVITMNSLSKVQHTPEELLETYFDMLADEELKEMWVNFDQRCIALNKRKCHYYISGQFELRYMNFGLKYGVPHQQMFKDEGVCNSGERIG